MTDAITKKWIKTAADEYAASLGYYFNERDADHVIEYFSTQLVHTNGQWRGKPFIPLEWQENDLLRPLFGWKQPDHLRRFRQGHIQVGKKNGKTTLMAGIANYMYDMDGEPGAQVYVVAMDRKQASISFNESAAQIRLSPDLSERLRVLPGIKRIVKRTAPGVDETDITQGFYDVLSGEADTKDGLNFSLLAFDELHAQKNRKMFDVLIYGGIARLEALMLSISTSGSDILSIGYEQYDYAKKVIAGIIKDPAFFGLVYEADPTDDWTKPETWYKANPSLGHIITEADMRQRCTEALESPSKQSAFKRLRLNLWVNADDPFFSMDRWDACGAKPLLPEALFGRDCYAALDLAATDDLSALTLTFPPMEPGEPFKALSWYWLPEEGLDKKSQKHGVRYDVWKDEGFLFTTPGPATDYEFIVQHLVRLKGQFNIIRVVYDPWKAQSTVNRLNDEGFEVVEVRQVISNFTGPMYELERLILQGEYAHGGNPITRWCAANTVAYTDANDNVRPSKIKSKNKIDGVVTSIMSLGQAMVHVESCSSMTLSEGIVWIDD